VPTNMLEAVNTRIECPASIIRELLYCCFVTNPWAGWDKVRFSSKAQTTMSCKCLQQANYPPIQAQSVITCHYSNTPKVIA
jgi:hypothetical protein